jgi:hypothetical protein
MAEHRMILDFCDEEYGYMTLKAKQMNCHDARHFLQTLVESFIIMGMQADGIDPEDLMGLEEDDSENLAFDFDDGIPF